MVKRGVRVVHGDELLEMASGLENHHVWSIRELIEESAKF